MDKVYMAEHPINLHNVAGLQEVYVRENIKLRPLEESDAGQLLEILAADPSIRNSVTVAARLHTKQDFTNEVKQYSSDKNIIRYTLLDRDKPIGLVTLWRDDGFFGNLPNPGDYGFGYFIDPKERGKGLITNAVQSLMNTTIKSLPVHQFMAFCEDSNNESQAVLSRLGLHATEETFTEPDNGWTERKYIKPLT